MSDEDFTTNPSGHESNQQPAAEPAGWGEPQPNYTQTAYPPPTPPPPGYAPAPAAEGLSDNTACALAYVTFIPAIICGHIARRQIRTTGQRGRRMATAGLVLGYLLLLLVLAFAVKAILAYFTVWS